MPKNTCVSHCGAGHFETCESIIHFYFLSISYFVRQTFDEFSHHLH